MRLLKYVTFELVPIFSIRGRLASLTMLSRNIGVLLIFSFGAYADYFTVPCIFIFFPIIFLICFSLLPNTPQFYFRNGRIEVISDCHFGDQNKCLYENLKFRKPKVH